MASYDVFEPLFTSQFIGGEWTASSSPNRIAVENPATLEKFAEIPDGTVDDIDRAVDAAYEALPAWRATPLEKRRALMQRFLEHFKAMRQAISDWADRPESHPGAPHRQYCRAEAQPVDAADGLPHDGGFPSSRLSKGCSESRIGTRQPRGC